MWLLPPFVNVDLNIVIVVSSMHADHLLLAVDTIVSGNTGGCCMLSVDTDDDDMSVV
jgi:hypothetical protein